MPETLSTSFGIATANRQNNHAEEIFTDTFGDQKLEYIHNNPVVEGWVEEPWDYLYSSAKNYQNGQGLLEVLFL